MKRRTKLSPREDLLSFDLSAAINYPLECLPVPDYLEHPHLSLVKIVQHEQSSRSVSIMNVGPLFACSIGLMER